MQDVMVDLETLGTGTNALILSIGAQAFQLETQQLYPQQCIRLKIDPVDAQRLGQVIDASTVSWWLKQDENARQSLSSDFQDTLLGALRKFTDWLNTYGPRRVWGNGATFDISILEDAYNLAGIAAPWKFRDVRDMRTIIDVAARLGVEVPRVKPTIAHDALADATAQAIWVNRTFAALQTGLTSNAIHQSG